MTQFHKTILIICEGAGTEPNYINELRNYVINKKEDVTITIKPRPKNEIKNETFNLREGGIKRKFQKEEIELPLTDIEDKFKAQPTRYVREAQLGIEDETYDEVWAVFDKDGHPEHKEAFELADIVINNKKVNIAFNSIAFEYWILLHFESNKTAFDKSMCRKRIDENRKEYFYCGKNTHPDDCNGINCVCGRIVSQAYLNYEDGKKSFKFSEFHPNVILAIERAVSLRNSYIGNPNPIYELNPYTTTDRLVFKLLQLTKNDFLWFDFSSHHIVNGFSFSLLYQNNNIQIIIKDTLDQTRIINSDLFCLINLNGELEDCITREILKPLNETQININLNEFNKFSPKYIGYRISESKYFISEIPF